MTEMVELTEVSADEGSAPNLGMGSTHMSIHARDQNVDFEDENVGQGGPSGENLAWGWPKMSAKQACDGWYGEVRAWTCARKCVKRCMHRCVYEHVCWYVHRHVRKKC